MISSMILIKKWNMNWRIGIYFLCHHKFKTKLGRDAGSEPSMTKFIFTSLMFIPYPEIKFSRFKKKCYLNAK